MRQAPFMFDIYPVQDLSYAEISSPILRMDGLLLNRIRFITQHLKRITINTGIFNEESHTIIVIEAHISELIDNPAKEANVIRLNSDLSNFFDCSWLCHVSPIEIRDVLIQIYHRQASNATEERFMEQLMSFETIPTGSFFS